MKNVIKICKCCGSILEIDMNGVTNPFSHIEEELLINDWEKNELTGDHYCSECASEVYAR